MKLYSIVFSPTGGTQKAASLLAGALEGEAVQVDLTDSKQDFHTVHLMRDDVAVIAVPSYAGRVPAVAVERLAMLNGCGARAVLVCVYGNRAYEDTLIELKDLAEILTATNPLKYDVSQASPFYGYKIKHLLTSTALGMMPAAAWNGRFDANGGYLVVKKDGEILCYHFYDRNRFEDYLFSNAYLERSSTSRHEYASIIKEKDGTLSFKLNFQIRLK